jgi:hypothetical protein
MHEQDPFIGGDGPLVRDLGGMQHARLAPSGEPRRIE